MPTLRWIAGNSGCCATAVPTRPGPASSTGAAAALVAAVAVVVDGVITELAAIRVTAAQPLEHLEGTDTIQARALLMALREVEVVSQQGALVGQRLPVEILPVALMDLWALAPQL